MKTSSTQQNPQQLPSGVMFNAYPDSIGERMSDLVALLKRPEFEDTFSLLYILPTFFNSDLDRGFSVIDYDINPELVSPEDIQQLKDLGIQFKFDLVLNHLSVRSPQFQDLLAHGDASSYRDFFVDWNEFWKDHATMGPDGYVIPDDWCLQKLFMRKPGLPILMVRFPDGSLRPYWNTFYQKIIYQELEMDDLAPLTELDAEAKAQLLDMTNEAIRADCHIDTVNFGDFGVYRQQITEIVEGKRDYLGQMDLNAQSDKVWEFYAETFAKLKRYGARIIRLDAFAYLHKSPGEANFFNKPGTWDYLDRLKRIALDYDLTIFPEIHAEYGRGLHEEVAAEGFPIYDFFFPGLVIDALDRGQNRALVNWIKEVTSKGLSTINMLGCHDGIPVLDLRGVEVDGGVRPGLLDDAQIEVTMERLVDRGGRVKNLYGADGKKIAYYQLNATFFSALGEDERKLLLARAIQMFIPGIPQVWYLDLFAGKNNYIAADRGGPAGHKEINRSNLSAEDIEEGLRRPVVIDQLDLIRMRNLAPAFGGELTIPETEPEQLSLHWKQDSFIAELDANLSDLTFSIRYTDAEGQEHAKQYL
ncbi:MULTISPECIES: alpha-amylase family glycosyl hydrolase [Thiorhodovibrio]|uniref:alpha-amylase family glycosyl hydrolase n=1 Tax=Thiorhodovibrio TaxID=61593 RepID=UPI00191380D0|nr:MULTISPECIES: alpha-amylase family glycosyl hydrolase [Thiorhodovibrio]MBK5967604.1 glycosidase [Thiorhodovibrio winogradskyi]WPL14955.1 Sucrose phosphorylase [Thiorhodovibrio litoralis]